MSDPSGSGSAPEPDRPQAGQRYDSKRLGLLTAAGVVVLALGLVAAAVAYRKLKDDSDPDKKVDPGIPVEQPDSTDGSDSTAAPDLGEPLADINLTVTEIAQFDTPISIVPRVDDTNLYVAERAGRVRRVAVEGDTYTPEGDAVIDISDEVTVEGERGLLDIAFSPDGKRLYLSFSNRADGASKLVSYGYDGSSVDLGSRREILTISDFASNHNGGAIEFGPDGYLYWAMGDGGGSGDPEKTAQDLDRLLGKILRIDPEGAAAGQPYAIPADNPFANGGGKPEIWLYGVRNPWRFSFDRATGDLWIGDVGQNEWEEIDYLPAGPDGTGAGRGANLGWSQMEGSHPFQDGSNPPDGVLPVFEYPNSDDGGCSITGGFVYRGSDHPDLTGAYLFGDFCMSLLRGIRHSGGGVSDERTFDAEVGQLVSFGQDNDGELYAVSLRGPVYRLDT